MKTYLSVPTPFQHHSTGPRTFFSKRLKTIDPIPHAGEINSLTETLGMSRNPPPGVLCVTGSPTGTRVTTHSGVAFASGRSVQDVLLVHSIFSMMIFFVDPGHSNQESITADSPHLQGVAERAPGFIEKPRHGGPNPGF